MNSFLLLFLLPLFLLLLLISINTHSSDPDLPIWLGLGGHVIDVSKSAYLYGPGKPRSCYAGRDATRISALQVRRILFFWGGGGERLCRCKIRSSGRRLACSFLVFCLATHL